MLPNNTIIGGGGGGNMLLPYVLSSNRAPLGPPTQAIGSTEDLLESLGRPPGSGATCGDSSGRKIRFRPFICIERIFRPVSQCFKLQERRDSFSTTPYGPSHLCAIDAANPLAASLNGWFRLRTRSPTSNWGPRRPLSYCAVCCSRATSRFTLGSQTASDRRFIVSFENFGK